MVVHHKGMSDSFSFETTLYIRPPDATHCLKCGYHNFLGYSQETIKAKVKQIIVPITNSILVPMGWQYIDTEVFGNYFEIYYKEASPVEPVTTLTVGSIATLIVIAIIGIAVISVAWVYIATLMEYAKAKADKKKLLEEGKITNEQYTQLIAEQKPEDMLGGLGDLLKWGLVLILVLAITGAIGRRKD